ncbi:lepA, partial [Symbiodinium microadriaticum]
QTYLLNLIDTPGHVDFSYEVIRSLASCQGALLLVDSSQSVQAQTLANHGYAKSLGLSLIPVVTKIDLPAAQPEETALNMSTTFDLDPDDCIMTSAREKIGIQEILEAVVQKLPPPTGDCELEETRLKARIVDSWFEEHRGMVCLVQVISGELYEGQRIITYASMNETDTKGDYSVQEVGLLTPTTLRTK